MNQLLVHLVLLRIANGPPANTQVLVCELVELGMPAASAMRFLQQLEDEGLIKLGSEDEEDVVQ